MKKILAAFTFSVLCLAGFATVSPNNVVGQQKNSKLLRSARPIPNRYIVVLKDSVAAKNSLTANEQQLDAAQTLTRAYGGNIDQTYQSVLHGYSAEMSEAQAEALSKDSRVAYVEEDGRISIDATQTGATWGLDRIDQRDLPLNGNYNYNATGNNVNAYIIDTGIRTSHNDFGGRAVVGFDAIGDGQNGQDCNGHGTHVAGTVGGATYGVAKNVRLYAVRVLNCSGSGSTSGVIAGLDWVANNRIAPAVANMSLGGGASLSLDNAVQRAVTAGVTVVVAAGNSNADACNSSPSRAANAITVGATTSGDVRSSFSNYGTCLDIFAPGSSITSDWYTSNTATAVLSGTSMASPHVAGAAALYLEANTTASPATVTNALINNASPNKVANAGAGSPNRLLYSSSGAASPSWVKCADENQFCSFSGTQTVRYGANGTYVIGTFTNGVNCNNAVFGDPVPGVVKSCEVSTAAPSINWIKCADENQFCSFDGIRQVRYGANGTYAAGTFTNGVACNNQTFGDPVVGVVKACEVAVPVTQTANITNEVTSVDLEPVSTP